MTTWWPARRRLALLAVASAALTGAAGAFLGGSGGHVYGAVGYVALTIGGLFAPAAIAAQVVAGQVLVGSVLLVHGAVAVPLLLPVVGGVVGTAELLAAVARLDAPFERGPGDALPGAGLAALTGAAVFAVVALVGVVPGPTGPVAVVLASGACVLLAGLLVKSQPR